jgi:hypothetical protein
VYHRLTDNWVELSLRFVTPVQGAVSRTGSIARSLAALDEKQIGIASCTFELVGIPRLRVVTEGSRPGSPGA